MLVAGDCTMPLTIQIPDDLMASVEQMVSDGTYADSESVVRDALKLLAETRERARLIESIREADRNFDEGHGIPLDEIDWDAMHSQAMANIASGRQPDPDVLPPKV
jgi:Arc/MetJ-type ribon-helix-helix transcriptional regulator